MDDQIQYSGMFAGRKDGEAIVNPEARGHFLLQDHDQVIWFCLENYEYLPINIVSCKELYSISWSLD